MFWGIANALLVSVSGILYKRALQLSTMSAEAFMQLGNFIGFLVAICLTIWDSSYFGNVTPIVAVLFTVLMLSGHYNGIRVQELNKTEKVSTLQIFGTLSTVLTLVAGFFLFSDTSLITLWLVLLAGLIVLASQFNGKKFEPPKSFKLLLTAYSVSAFNGLLMAYIIKSIGAIGYFSIGTSMHTFFLVGLMVWQGKSVQDLTSWTKTFYTYRFGTGIVGQATRLISFFLIWTLGPIVSTLLGMLSNVSSLLLSIFMLHEKPTAKEWITNCLLMVCIGLGFYFK